MMNDSNPPEHPGLILKLRFLDPLGIRPSELAKSIGVSGRRVSELLKGRRRLSPEMAHRLALYFGVPPRWFLEMQARFDAHTVENGSPLLPYIRPMGQSDGFIITPGGALPIRKSASPAPAPLSVHVSEEFIARLKAQAALSGRKLNCTPKLVTMPDGTSILAGESNG